MRKLEFWHQIMSSITWILSPSGPILYNLLMYPQGFSGGTSCKGPTCQCRRRKRGGFNPWVRSGRSPGGGSGNPLQHSCLENPMDKGALWATVHRVTKSRTRLKQLSTHAPSAPETVPGTHMCTINNCWWMVWTIPKLKALFPMCHATSPDT